MDTTLMPRMPFSSVPCPSTAATQVTIRTASMPTDSAPSPVGVPNQRLNVSTTAWPDV